MAKNRSVTVPAERFTDSMQTCATCGKKTDNHVSDVAGNKYLCTKCAGFEPDYGHSCQCGNTPIIPRTGMCGVCTFGEAACLDPEEW